VAEFRALRVHFPSFGARLDSTPRPGAPHRLDRSIPTLQIADATQPGVFDTIDQSSICDGAERRDDSD